MRSLQSINVDHLPADGLELPNRLFPFMWHFLRQVKWPVAYMTAIFLLSSSVEALMYYFIKILIDGFNTATTPDELRDILLWPAIVFVVVVMILQPTLARYGQSLMATIRPAFTNLMRRQLALYMHNHSYQYFQEDFAGRLASKVVETPTALGNIMQDVIASVGFAFCSLMVAMVLFSMTYWGFAVMTLVWISLYIMLLTLFIPRIHKQSKSLYDNQSIVRGRFVDTLTNILTVKLFARQKHEDTYLLDSLRITTRSAQKLGYTMNDMQIWLEVLSSLLIGGAFAVAVIGWSNGALTAGDVAMALPLAMRLMMMSWWMSNVFTGLFENLGQVAEGMDTITQAQTVQDHGAAPALTVAQGHIRFRDVTFAYGSNVVFDGLNIDIPPGQKVGLIGPSGAGKSTVVQMLLRLYDVRGGAITIDDQDIAKVTQESLRHQIAVIPQTTDLLHRSIRDNIRYGRLDASDTDIIDAAKRAFADDFIIDLRDQKDRRGYDAIAGERGVKLSGGQRQRIAIARAILKNAPILILDEATSALDSESEQMIQTSLEDLMQGKTVLAIAHRLSTIAHMDRLIVLDKGRIVEDGTHAALLARNGLYARLWALQSGGFLKQSDRA